MWTLAAGLLSWAVGAAPAAAVHPGTIGAFLRAAGLADHRRALHAYGVRSCADVALLDEEDLLDVGLGAVAARKLLKAAAACEDDAGNDDDAAATRAAGSANIAAAADELHGVLREDPSYADMSMASLLKEAESSGLLEEDPELKAQLKELEKIDLGELSLDDLLELGQKHAAGGMSDEDLLAKISGLESIVSLNMFGDMPVDFAENEPLTEDE